MGVLSWGATYGLYENVGTLCLRISYNTYLGDWSGHNLNREECFQVVLDLSAPITAENAIINVSMVHLNIHILQISTHIWTQH